MQTDQHQMNSAEARVIHARLDSIVDSVGRLADSFASMQQSLQALIELRAQQGHIVGQLASGASTMEKHEGRLQKIEQDMPGLKELRRWVIAGVLAGVGMIGTALVKLVVIDIPRMQQLIHVEPPRQRPQQPGADGQ